MAPESKSSPVGRSRYNSYSEVTQLGAAELLVLTRVGDEPERVWATWALALAGQDDAFHSGLVHVDQEPAPGVRRNLIVLVAGRGEISSLQLLAISDPDADVRETASLYLARLSEQREIPNTFLDERLLRESADSVRVSILDVAGEQLRPIAERPLAHALRDAKEANRERAIKYLRSFGADVCPGLLSAAQLSELAATEPSRTLLEKLCRLCVQALGPESLLRIAANRDSHAELPLQVLKEIRMSFAWPVLSAFALSAPLRLSPCIVPVMQEPNTAGPVHWLIERVAALESASADPLGEPVSDAASLRNMLYRCLSNGIEPRPTHAAAGLMKHIESELQQARIDLVLEDPEWDISAQIDYLQTWIQALEPWSRAASPLAEGELAASEALESVFRNGSNG